MRKWSSRSDLTNVKDVRSGKGSEDLNLDLCNDKFLLLYLHHDSTQASAKPSFREKLNFIEFQSHVATCRPVGVRLRSLGITQRAMSVLPFNTYPVFSNMPRAK